MRSILITGGSGFLGTHLSRQLLESGAERVCILSRGEHRQAAMRAELNDSRLRWFIGDVRDRERLERAMQGVDLVIHAAALKRIEVGYSNPDEMVKTNILGTMNVIEAAAWSRVSRVLLVSSDKAYQPVSAYGQSKALAESLFLAANNVHPGTRYAVVRYGNVWCSSGSVVPTWRQRLATGEPLEVTDVECTRFFMTVRQACDLVLGTARTMQGGELAIPDLPAYRVGDLLQAFIPFGTHPRVKIVGLPAWEKLHESMSDERCSKSARRMTVDEIRGALDAA